MTKKHLHVQILSQEQELWSGVAHSVSVPALDGRVTILPHHAPGALYPLGEGMVRVDKHDKLQITLGFASVEDSAVRIMIN
jgi:F0F1-type ATP synthase epsilon subunit